MKNKFIILIFGVLAIAFVAVSLPAPSNKVASDWKTYQDQRYWYQVSYPGNSSVSVEASQPNLVHIAGIRFWADFYYGDPSSVIAGTPQNIGSHTWFKAGSTYSLLEDGELLRLDVSPTFDLQLLDKILSTFSFITFPGQQRLDKTILSMKDGDIINNLKVVGKGQMSYDSGTVNADSGSVVFSGQLTLTGQYSLEGMTLSDALASFLPDATSSEKLPQFDHVDAFPGGTYFHFDNKDFAVNAFGSYRGTVTVLVDNLSETVTPQYKVFGAKLIKIISKP
jgi:hypothetical protein